MRWRLLFLSILASLVNGQAVNGCDPECDLQNPMANHPLVKCGKIVGDHPIYGKKCIYLTKTRDKMPVMKGVCESLEWTNNTETIKTGALVTLNNAVENNATRDYINSLNSAESSATVYFAYAFIGLRKTCRHCSFHWTDNEPFTYANWYGTEPNTYYYDCAHIRTLSPYFGKWIDMSCSSTYHAVCMFYKSGKTPQKEEPIIPSKGGCKPGWWAYGGYCYKDFGFEPGFGTGGHMTYQLGNNSCVAGSGGEGQPDWPGSRMAILPSMEHNQLLAALMGPGRYHNDIWIGIYNHAYYDYYFSLDNFQKLVYDNWVPGYPNHVQGNINKCVRMKWTTETKFQGDAELGQWINDHCTNVRLPWVCSHEQDSQYASNYEYPTSFALSNVKCPRGWIPYHTSCYKLYNQPMDFDSANEQCSKDKPSGANYATLITGWDEYEILFMSTFLRDDQLQNRSPSDLPDGYWIGVKNMENRFGGKSFQFVDGWPMTYTKYAGNGDTPGDCIFMRPDGKWDNTMCNNAKPFVCKAEFYDWMPNYQDIDKKLGPLLPCESGWELHGHHCVKVFTQPKNWNDADADCEFNGGHLVSIHSENYNQWVRALFQNATKNIPAPDWDGFWSGMSYTGLEWKWSDKSIVQYFNWGSGEPNNWEGQTEDCVEIYNDGFWNDDPCSAELPYVCKKVAQTEWCAVAALSGSQKKCGEAGTNEEECRRVFGCCWDPSVEINGFPGNHCFKPSAPINVGMAAGAAVAVTLVVIGIAAGGYFYYTKYGFSAPGTGGISNPVA